MGVSHLQKHANSAQGAASAASGPQDATQIRTSMDNRFKQSSDTRSVPQSGPVNSFSNKALKGSSKPGQPEHGGARMGSKGGRPNIGSRDHTQHPMSGGRLG